MDYSRKEEGDVALLEPPKNKPFYAGILRGVHLPYETLRAVDRLVERRPIAEKFVQGGGE
jgi:hypothetical protein